jgi:hypothetical protein
LCDNTFIFRTLTMFTRRRFLTTAAVFTGATAAPRLLFAQTVGDDLTALEEAELRSLLRQAKTAEERQRIRAEINRRSSGGTTSQQPAAEQPATEAPATRDVSLTPEQRDELRRRMSEAQTREERRKIRQEYFDSLGQEPVGTETGSSETPSTQEPAPSGQTPSAGNVPAIDEALPLDNEWLTQSERAQFKARMQAARSAEERKAIRDEYKALVRQRPHQRGKGAEQSGGKGKGGSGTQGKPQDEGEETLLLPQGKGKKKKK